MCDYLVQLVVHFTIIGSTSLRTTLAQQRMGLVFYEDILVGTCNCCVKLLKSNFHHWYFRQCLGR